MQTHSYKDLLGAAEVKELIFKYQESLMCYYMGLSVTEEKVSSPLREDTTANCNFYYSDTGTLRFMDWALWKSYSIIDVIMLKEQVNYYGALDIIKDDIFTKDFRRVYKKFKKRIPKKVSFSPKSWEEEDSKYWDSYGVKQNDLLNWLCVPIKQYKINGIEFKTPVCSYAIMASSGGTRVYKPLQPRDNRHFSNCKQGNVLGMSSLFDHSFCVITSSMKDGVVLNTFGIPAVAPATSEVDMISKHYIDTLVLRYGKVYVMMDNDEAGLKTNQRYAEQYSLEYKMFEGASDISDYRAAFGEVATRSLINSLFNVSR